MAEIRLESVADFIPESVADFLRNTHLSAEWGEFGQGEGPSGAPRCWNGASRENIVAPTIQTLALAKMPSCVHASACKDGRTAVVPLFPVPIGNDKNSGEGGPSTGPGVPPKAGVAPLGACGSMFEVACPPPTGGVQLDGPRNARIPTLSSC
jgi:hypothetical protein